MIALEMSYCRGRDGYRCRRWQYWRVSDPLAIGAPRRPLPGGSRDGRHGIQLRRRDRGGVRPLDPGLMCSVRSRSTVWLSSPETGRFLCTGMEIHTALQYGLPVTFVLFDNHAHAMCVNREQLFYGGIKSLNQ